MKCPHCHKTIGPATGIRAEIVFKLRDETNMPLMRCKAALEESHGDVNRAKEILRTRGLA